MLALALAQNSGIRGVSGATLETLVSANRLTQGATMAKASKGNTTTTTGAAPSLLTDSTQGATTDTTTTTQNGTGTTQDSAAPKKADICREAAAAGCSTLKAAQEWAAERYPGVSLSQSNWWAATRNNGNGGEKQKGGGIMPADLLTLSALMGKLGGIEPVEQLADILSRNSIDGLRETLDVLAQLTGAAKK